MFSGIIADVGSISQATDRDGGLRLVIATSALDLSDVQAGDSIAVNGICLTVIEHSIDSFAVDVSRETLNCTEGLDAIGAPVNLELSLIHISEPTRLGMISYAVFCLKQKN